MFNATYLEEKKQMNNRFQLYQHKNVIQKNEANGQGILKQQGKRKLV